MSAQHLDRLAQIRLNVVALREELNAGDGLGYCAAVAVLRTALCFLDRAARYIQRPTHELRALDEVRPLRDTRDADAFAAKLLVRSDADEQAALLTDMSQLFAGLTASKLADVAGLAEDFGYFETDATRAIDCARRVSHATEMRNALIELLALVTVAGPVTERARELVEATALTDLSTPATTDKAA